MGQRSRGPAWTWLLTEGTSPKGSSLSPSEANFRDGLDGQGVKEQEGLQQWGVSGGAGSCVSPARSHRITADRVCRDSVGGARFQALKR